MNYLLDINIILDNFNIDRRNKYPESIKTFDIAVEMDNVFISVSSLDNIEFLKIRDLRINKGYSTKQAKKITDKLILFLLSKFKIAKTPSYIEIDLDDIEDSQILASAKAIDAKIITRDKNLLQKHSEVTISPNEFQSLFTNHYHYNIDFANLKKQYFLYYNEFEKELDKVLNSARYIMGEQIEELENNLCEFTGAKHAIACGSGTDALLLALMAIDIKPGDEVITTPFTFIATAETIALLGAKPVFVDIDEKTYNIDVNKIEEKITDKTKAIVAVSLFGQPCDLDELNLLIHSSTHHPIYLIVDGAQSFGATYKGKAEVHYCDIYTTSFFPAKPLGCFGDGGAVLTNNNELAEKIKMLKAHGQNKRYYHKYIGLNARMDTLQAAALNIKLKHYKEDLKLRQKVASTYTKFFSSLCNQPVRSFTHSPFYLFTHSLIFPFTKNDRTSAWAQYSIRLKAKGKGQKVDELRQKIQELLKKAGIPTAIHYPMPLHLQECFKYLGYKKGDFPVAEKVSKEIISLPMNPYLTEEEINYIVDRVKEVIYSYL